MVRVQRPAPNPRVGCRRVTAGSGDFRSGSRGVRKRIVGYSGEIAGCRRADRLLGASRGARLRGWRCMVVAWVLAVVAGVACAPACALDARGHVFGFGFAGAGTGAGQSCRRPRGLRLVMCPVMCMSSMRAIAGLIGLGRMGSSSRRGGGVLGTRRRNSRFVKARVCRGLRARGKGSCISRGRSRWTTPSTVRIRRGGMCMSWPIVAVNMAGW